MLLSLSSKKHMIWGHLFWTLASCVIEGSIPHACVKECSKTMDHDKLEEHSSVSPTIETMKAYSMEFSGSRQFQLLR